MARVDYDKQSAVYDEGRTLPPEVTELWMVVARRHIPEARLILDLGSGTGRFSAALADTYEATVVGVEPSAGMRNRAASKPHDNVHIVAGNAESLPLADDSCDLAWLSNVTHHFDDLVAASRELRRVTSSHGSVFVRGSFAARDHPSLYRFFPGTKEIIDSMPSLPDTIGAFQAAGFTSFYNENVEYKIADSLAEMLPRTRKRADSALELITDEEFASGLEQLEKAAQVENGPVIDRLDVLVLR